MSNAVGAIIGFHIMHFWVIPGTRKALLSTVTHFHHHRHRRYRETDQD
ncbi:MAG: hypothetical protein Q4B68_07165 [Bacteroidales bacterium]|nr:hypothetical protein [Bacteroidales bacterium]